MKLKALLIIILVTGSQGVRSQHSIDSSRIVRVLSFNILHGATTRGDYNLDVIADVIKDADPDFVALQEVDFKTNRAQGYDLATELAWRVQMVPVFGRAMKYDGGEYGEGLLSRYSMLQSRNVALPHTQGKEPRSALELITILPPGDTIAFVGTHLDHTKDENDRVAQAKRINEVFLTNTYPTILAGDLNGTPGSPPINILEEYWQASYDSLNPEPTFPSDKPVKKIDYVMTYPKGRWKVLETMVIKDAIASDHCAYLVILELLVQKEKAKQ